MCGQTQKFAGDRLPPGTLLFVEDLGDPGGLTDTDFGDVVGLDPVSGLSFVLTRDGFYDRHPVASPNGRYVLYSSTRDPRTRFQSVGSPRSIYKLTIKTGRVDEWPPALDVDAAWNPAVDHSGNRVALYSDEQVIVYDAAADNFTSVSDSMLVVHRLAWSPNDSLLAFEGVKRGSPLAETIIVIVDLETNEEQVYGRPSWSFRLGDVTDFTLLFVANEHRPASEIILGEANLEEGTTEEIMRVSRPVDIVSPVYNQNEHISFIRHDGKGGQIFLLDRRSGQSQQLTNTLAERSDLRVVGGF